MNKPGQSKKPAAKQSGVNPFAKALVETNSRSSDDQTSKTKSDSQLFSEALAKTGGSIPTEKSQEKADEKQQQEFKKQAEKQALKKKLHDKVNPVDNHEIFEARRQKELKEIEQLRSEVALLMADIGSLQKEAEVTLMTQIADPGEDGSYFKNFFMKLKSFIMLLRQKVKSARTWAQQSNSRKKKMAKRRGGGMVVNTQETKFVQDTMHHEKSTAYTGA